MLPKLSQLPLLISLAVLAALPDAVRATDPSAHHGVEIQVEVVGGATGVPAAAIFTHHTPDGDPEMQRSTLQAPTRFGVPLKGRFVELRLEADGYWAPSAFLVEGGPKTHTIRLYPTVTATGRLEMPPGEALPSTIDLRFQQALHSTGEPPIPLGRQTCAVHDSRFRCPVPVGKIDLRARAKGFVSHYWWGLAPEAGEALPLGALTLRRGGSIIGWVEYGQGQTTEVPALEGVRVRAEPRAASDARASDPRTERIQLETQTDSRGFFHLTGVSPGQYRLVAEKEGFAPGVLETSNIVEHSETNLARPILLQRPARVEVRVSPFQDPAGKPWWFHLIALDTRSRETVAEGPADEDGVWHARGIAQGRYSLEVSDAFDSRWHFEEISIQEESASFEIQLDALLVEGEISFGGEPLAADLWFGGRNGFRRFAFSSGEDGTFAGTLPPQEEPWPVTIESRAPEIQTTVREVEVQPGEHGIARIRIDLVDRRVEGRVTDPDGDPTPDVWVFLQGVDPPARPVQRRTGKDGGFQFGPVEPGLYKIQALIFGTAVTSPRVTVEVPAEEGQVPYQHLKLREGRILTGKVISPFGPVTGAMVSATPLIGEESAATILPQADTDVRGAFHLEIPADAETVRMTIAAPAYVLRVVSIDAQPAGPVTIPVHPAGGTLRLHFAPELSFDEMRMRYYLLHGDIPLNAVTLLQWTRTQGGGMVAPGLFEVPAVDPGEITVCMRTQEGPRCEVSGFLAPSDILDLHFLPLPKED